MNTRVEVDETMSLEVGRGIRLKHDDRRNVWTLMAPERVILLDEIAHEVINELVNSDGGIAGVIDRMSERFAAPRDEIAADVIEMLQALVDKQLLREK